jgi:shikimate dehydrogenase
MKRYGLLGRTLTHSFSKDYFAQKFAEQGLQDIVYENFELKNIGEFAQLLSAHADLKGVNVTIPYKEDVLQFLTARNEIVEAIGACNCIKIDGENLTGYNTDVIGFRNALEPQLKPQHKKALVLGTGGAAKAICYVLSGLGIETRLVSRRKEEGQCGYEDLGEELLSTHQIVVNTTPLGMYPNVNADPPVPYEFVTREHFFFDLIYNPPKTKFLEEAEKRGAQISNGQQMLIEQAEESWRIWSKE